MGFSFVPRVLYTQFLTSKASERKSLRAARAFVFGTSILMLLISAASAQSAPAADTYIDSANSSMNFGSATGLEAASGKASLIQFDLTALPSGVTASQIDKAVLRLFVNQVSSAGGIDVSEVSSAWSEATVTYNTRPTTSATIASNVPTTTANTFVLIDVTTLVQQWISSPSQNHGVQITSAAAQPTTDVTFDSKENSATSHEPELEITLSQGQAQAAAVQLWSAFLPAFSPKYMASTFTPGSAITVSRIQARVVIPPSNCRTNAVIQISDGTTAQTLPITAAENDSGPLSLNYSAGMPITLSISTPAQCGFGVWPQLGNVLVQYASH